VDGQNHVLGGRVAAAVGSTGAEQDDHLDELRQREVRARGSSPLGQLMLLCQLRVKWLTVVKAVFKLQQHTCPTILNLKKGALHKLRLPIWLDSKSFFQGTSQVLCLCIRQ
jgi:hypothetical protein